MRCKRHWPQLGANDGGRGGERRRDHSQLVMPGAVNARRWHVTGICVDRGAASIESSTVSHGALERTANSAARRPAMCRTVKVSTVSADPEKPFRRKAALTPFAARTLYVEP